MNKIELQDPLNHRRRILVDIERYKVLKLMGWLPVEAKVVKAVEKAVKS